VDVAVCHGVDIRDRGCPQDGPVQYINNAEIRVQRGQCVLRDGCMTRMTYEIKIFLP